MQRTYQFSEIGPTRVEGELAALLMREGSRKHFAAGRMIQQQGDEGNGFWLIESGEINVCRFDPDGDVTVFAVLGAGDLFGELAYFAGVPRQADALAESDAVLVRISARLIESLLAREPDFARWLLRSLSNQLRIALDRIDGERGLPAEGRVRQALVEMAKRDGPELNLTQQSLGDLVGVSRVTIGQVLGKLAKEGLVHIGYRKILLTDVAALTDHRRNRR